MRVQAFTTGSQAGGRDSVELEAPAAEAARAGDARPEVGLEEGAAPAEEAAQAVEADPVVAAAQAGAVVPVGADEPIGTCTGLVYPEF